MQNKELSESESDLVMSTLGDPMDCSLPGFSVHGDSPGKKTGVGCYALLTLWVGNFHFKKDLYPLVAEN